MRSAIAHDVTLAAEHLIALETTEMMHVPLSTFRFGALVSEYNLRQKKKEVKHQKIDVLHVQELLGLRPNLSYKAFHVVKNKTNI